MFFFFPTLLIDTDLEVILGEKQWDCKSQTEINSVPAQAFQKSASAITKVEMRNLLRGISKWN